MTVKLTDDHDPFIDPDIIEWPHPLYWTDPLMEDIDVFLNGPKPLQLITPFT